MTALLQRAIEQISGLPSDQQDAIAQRLLDELGDEQAWAERFSGTRQEQWDGLAAGVRREIAAGDTAPPATIPFAAHKVEIVDEEADTYLARVQRVTVLRRPPADGAAGLSPTPSRW